MNTFLNQILRATNEHNILIFETAAGNEIVKMYTNLRIEFLISFVFNFLYDVQWLTGLNISESKLRQNHKIIHRTNETLIQAVLVISFRLTAVKVKN